MTTAERLYKVYGVTIVKDIHWNPLKGRFVKSYKMYSADGCPWDNGKPTLKACVDECKSWGGRLKAIKRQVEQYKDV